MENKGNASQTFSEERMLYVYFIKDESYGAKGFLEKFLLSSENKSIFLKTLNKKRHQKKEKKNKEGIMWPNKKDE